MSHDPSPTPVRMLSPVEPLFAKVITIVENNKRGIEQLDNGLARLEKKVDHNNELLSSLILKLDKSNESREKNTVRIFVCLLVLGLLSFVSIGMSALVLLHETQAKPMIIVPLGADKLSQHDIEGRDH